jgi:hypothetical protein
VVKFPRYRKLFGAVSISNAYRSYSRRLIAAFLMLNNYSPDLANWVRPRSPFYQRSLSKTAKTVAALRWETLDELSSGLSSIEKDGKGVPILIRQYLKLGGKVLAFNLDRRFSNTLDGLMIVDLDQTDRRILRRTMGPEGMEAFLAAPHPHAAAQPPLAQCK